MMGLMTKQLLLDWKYGNLNISESRKWNFSCNGGQEVTKNRKIWLHGYSHRITNLLFTNHINLK